MDTDGPELGDCKGRVAYPLRMLPGAPGSAKSRDMATCTHKQAIQAVSKLDMLTDAAAALPRLPHDLRPAYKEDEAWHEVPTAQEARCALARRGISMMLRCKQCGAATGPAARMTLQGLVNRPCKQQIQDLQEDKSKRRKSEFLDVQMTHRGAVGQDYLAPRLQMAMALPEADLDDYLWRAGTPTWLDEHLPEACRDAAYFQARHIWGQGALPQDPDWWMALKRIVHNPEQRAHGTTLLHDVARLFWTAMSAWEPLDYRGDRQMFQEGVIRIFA